MTLYRHSCMFGPCYSAFLGRSFTAHQQRYFGAIACINQHKSRPTFYCDQSQQRRRAQHLLFQQITARHFSSRGVAEFFAQCAPITQEFWDFVATSGPTRFTGALFTFAHDSLHMPWWCVSVSAALAIKVLMMPVAIRSHEVNLKLMFLQPELVKISKQLQSAIQKSQMRHLWTQEHANKVYRQTMLRMHRELVLENNCSPFVKVAATFFNVPFWLCATVAFRNLSGANFNVSGVAAASMQTEGFYWISNIAQLDSYFIITFLYFCLQAFSLLLSRNSIYGEAKKMGFSKPNTASICAIYMQGFFAVFMTTVSVFQPACVSLFWLSSMSTNVLQPLLLKNSRIRKILRMRKMEDFRVNVVPIGGAKPRRNATDEITIYVNQAIKKL